jgi:mono/diheme cytochrome c family protein
VAWRNRLPAEPPAASTPGHASVERGRYLATAGNCIGCHTTRGGVPYAGGRAIDTPFGTVFSSNLTPDATGLGAWSADDFWRALHHGRSRDGRLLYPVFPYPNYTEVTRDDADALFAFLRSLPPARQPNRLHALRFPYGTQPALAVWRSLFFDPGSYRPRADRPAAWNRGAYLVRGLGHCSACHAPRNPLGATAGDQRLSGGLIPQQKWYAPSLTATDEAGVADWDAAEVVQLLKTGVAPRGSAMGPMAEVVWRSTQYLSDGDLHAIATYLKDLPPAPRHAPSTAEVDANQVADGRALYARHCADCHGATGQGATRQAYPPLAGNRAVTMADPTNLLRAIIAGGFPPSTAGNPRPYGMPPFGAELDDREIAAIATFLRRSWGHDAAPVSALQVLQVR